MVQGIGGVGKSNFGSGIYASYIPSGGSNGISYSKYLDGYKQRNKVSFGEGFGAFCKGLIKPIVNIFKHPVKSALMIGLTAALIIGTGGAAVPFLVAAGVAMGGFQIAKGGYKALTANSKAEKLGAWEDVGEGTFTVGASLAGAKSYAKTTPGGSMVTKNLAAVGKDASFGTKTAAAVKGLGSDTWTTIKASPKSLHRTVSMIRTGEFAGNLQSATLSSRLAMEHRNVAKIRDEFGASSTEYKNALAKYTKHKAYVESKSNGITDKVFDKYVELAPESKYYTEEGLAFCDRGLVSINRYANIFRNKPAINIGMGIGNQLDIAPDTVQTIKKAAPSYGIDLFPELKENPYLDSEIPRYNFAA